MTKIKELEVMEKMPLPEALKFAEQLREMYVTLVRDNGVPLEPAALRKLDAQIAETRKVVKQLEAQ